MMNNPTIEQNEDLIETYWDVKTYGLCYCCGKPRFNRNILGCKGSDVFSRITSLMNSSLNPPFEMGDQAKPKRCLEY